MIKRDLDAIDRKIIDLLSENARISIKDIAAAVFLSSPAVTARMKKLEERGVILGYHADIHPDYR